MNPMAPTIRNASSQPHCLAMKGTERGARIAPTLEPELKIPVAKERSRLGKYSAVALIADGKLPASPTASTIRAIIKAIRLTEAITGTISPVALIRPSELSIPVYHLVTRPQAPCIHAPKDHKPIAQA